jgi:class 3 adenylate cyclase
MADVAVDPSNLARQLEDLRRQLLFFNDPLPLEDHELGTVRFAVAAQERFTQLAQRWRRRGTKLELGIGIEAGMRRSGGSASKAATTAARWGR